MCYSRPEGPACVETCPAKALTFGNIADIKTAMGAYAYKAGDGHMFWASRKPFTAPTTDPYIEDHISPMFDRLIKAPVAKALLLPTLLLGGTYALYRRREQLEAETKETL
jgi:Fe-S-cluster-containing dehydrogenase component